MSLGKGLVIGHWVTLRRFLRTFVLGAGRTLKRRGGGHQIFDLWFGNKERGSQPTIQQDAKTEGWLAQRWRPIFALAFTACFVMIAVTVCRGIWIGQLAGVEAVTGLLITMLAAGCAVLGVQIWQRSEEKKAGMA